MPCLLEDDFAGLLWAAGSLGQHVALDTANGVVEVTAFFAASAPPFALPADWSRRGVEALGEESVGEEDWQAGFRRAAVPFPVGRRLILDPSEIGGRFLLHLPARDAFGTGTHESTRLALELIEDLDLGGRSVLDVGSGTGVLALAALRFGAARAVALDLDLAAAFATRDNARRNAVAGCLPYAGPIEALTPSARFDVGLLNVVPDEARPILPALTARLAAGADLIASGLLGTQAVEWGAELGAAGFAPVGEARSGEWAALRLRRGRR